MKEKCSGSGRMSRPDEGTENAMLVLSRKINESIVIGDNIVITVLKVDRNTVRLGIEAPQAVKVFRHELLEQKPDDHLAGNHNSAAADRLGNGQ